MTYILYRPACGQIEARYPDRTCLVWYLCSHVLYLLAVHANLPVSGVRLSSPDSGPMCTYVGSWPSFWARFWGLVCELFLFFWKICNVGICLEWVCGGRCQVSPAGGWCAWGVRPCLGQGFDTSPSAWPKLIRTQNCYSCLALTAALPRAGCDADDIIPTLRRVCWEMDVGRIGFTTGSSPKTSHECAPVCPAACLQLSAHSRKKHDLHRCSESCDRCWRNKIKRPRLVLEHGRSRPCL